MEEIAAAPGGLGEHLEGLLAGIQLVMGLYLLLHLILTIYRQILT
jgi:hypothetical protein